MVGNKSGAREKDLAWHDQCGHHHDLVIVETVEQMRSFFRTEKERLV